MILDSYENLVDAYKEIGLSKKKYPTTFKIAVIYCSWTKC